MLCCCPMLCFMHTCATNTNIVGCTNTFQRTQLWRPLEWHVIGLKCNQCKTTFEEWACLQSHLRVYVQLGWFRVCFCHPSLLQGQAVKWPSKLLLQLVMVMMVMCRQLCSLLWVVGVSYKASASAAKVAKCHIADLQISGRDPPALFPSSCYCRWGWWWSFSVEISNVQMNFSPIR